MREGNSKPVISTQSGAHEKLRETVQKHLNQPFRKPIADHSRVAFDQLLQSLPKAPSEIILDSGCGTGDSTRQLAQLFPDHLVIGVDKSASRLARERDAPNPENASLVRADLVDFWRLAAEAQWQLQRHYILYPNPWPKPEHLKRRWHGSPVWPVLLQLGGDIELRTNWGIYAAEFAEALTVAGFAATSAQFVPDGTYLTPFEEKYTKSGHTLWRVTARNPLEGSTA